MRNVIAVKTATVVALMLVIGGFAFATDPGNLRFNRYPWEHWGYTVIGYNGTANGELVIPATHNGFPVTAIGDFAFRNHQLTSLVLPEGITHIGFNAFLDNRLTNVVFPDSIRNIAEGAFQGNQLVNVDFPQNANFFGSTFSRPSFDPNVTITRR